MRQFNFTVRASRAPLPWGIRAAMQLQADPAKPERGDRLLFFWHDAGRLQVQLGRGTCKSAETASLFRLANGSPRMIVADVFLLQNEMDEIARDSGFASTAAFFKYFETTYGLPFTGRLLRW